MKKIQLALVLSSALLLASGFAQAESNVTHTSSQHQFFSKRPYQAPLAASAYQKQAQQNDAQWEGATFVSDLDSEQESRLSQQKTQRMNMLSKRPY